MSKTTFFKLVFCWHLRKVNDETSRIHPDPDPLVRGMDPRIQIRIRIHPKMSWIRNTATRCGPYDMVGFGGRGARLPTFYDLCRLLEFCPALKRLSVVNNVAFDSDGDFFFSDVPQPADLVMRGPSLKLLQLVGDIFAVAGNNVLTLARSCPALERLIVAGGEEGSFGYEAGLEKTRFFI